MGKFLWTVVFENKTSAAEIICFLVEKVLKYERFRMKKVQDMWSVEATRRFLAGRRRVR